MHVRFARTTHLRHHPLCGIFVHKRSACYRSYQTPLAPTCCPRAAQMLLPRPYQVCPRLVQKLTDVAVRFTNADQIWPTCGPIAPSGQTLDHIFVVQLWPVRISKVGAKSGSMLSHLCLFVPKLAKFGRSRAESTPSLSNFRSICVNTRRVTAGPAVDEFWPRVHKRPGFERLDSQNEYTRTTKTKWGTTRTEFGLTSAKFGAKSANVGQLEPCAHQTWVDVGRILGRI